MVNEYNRAPEIHCRVLDADRVVLHTPTAARWERREYVFSERREASCFTYYPSRSVADVEPTGMNLTSRSEKGRELPSGVKLTLLLEVLQHGSGKW